MTRRPFCLPDAKVYDGMSLYGMCADAAPRVKELDTTAKDVYIATFPRSGTTWISEVMSMIHFHKDLKKYRDTPRYNRVLFLELKAGDDVYGMDKAVELYGNRRILMTHFPYRYIKKQVEENNSRAVVVVRNPRDCFVSNFNFYRSNSLLGPYQGSFNDFFEDLVKPQKLVWGDWLEHVRSYWEVRHLENIHLIFYEDAVDDLKTTVRNLAKFMGETLTDGEVNEITELAQFDTMKANSDTIFRGSEATVPGLPRDMNGGVFFRRGKYGTWREVFTQEQDEYLSNKYDEQLKNLGIKLKQ